MDVLAFRGAGYLVMGVLLLTMLVIAFISMRKEARADEPVRGLLWLTVVILAVCTFLAHTSAYISARSVQNQRPPIPTNHVARGEAVPQ